MLSVEATGKNVDEAVDNALFELKAIREDVDIKILEPGGFFKKAKVLVSISDDAKEKYEKKEKFKQEEQKQEECCLDSCLEEKNEKVEEEKPEKQKDIDADEEVEVIISKTAVKTSATDAEKAQYFINGVLDKAHLTANIEIKDEKDDVLVNVSGASDIIGYRGEGLNALQYLTSVVVSKNNRHSKKIRLDCDGYRARREETLIALAHRMEQKVKKTHSSVKLEPMTANERRIIHSALSESEFVETCSKGEEPHRYLTISPKQN